tara:strand:+ start:71 stop:994 length:924 start_codon:yes stop_codon:yes gene_type:complete
MKKIIIGSRGSKLSLAYAAKVKTLILEKNPKLRENDLSIKPIKTSGDIFYDKKLSEIGGKNLFCKEIEESLIKKEIDVAVHSLKDMDSTENSDLVIGAYIKRNDPRDVFISSKFNNLEELKSDSIIGSSSRRRELQLKLINKNINILNIRGNIDSRIKKIEDEKIDGIILAAAGVESLKLKKNIKKIFSVNEMLPAVGQGVIAAQCRDKDKEIKNILNKANYNETNICSLAERHMLKVIGGDCDTAVGGLAILEKNNIKLKAQLFSDDGKKVFNTERIGSIKDPELLGKLVGKELLKKSGKDYIKKK